MAGEGVFGIVQSTEDLATSREVALSFFGEPVPTSVAMDEFGTQPAFELRDGPADEGLRAFERVSSRGKAVVLHDGPEDLHLQQAFIFHRCSIWNTECLFPSRGIR